MVGAVNGEWKVLNGGGAYTLRGGGGENPYQQMRTQYRVLSEWLERRKMDFLSPDRTNITRFRARNYRERTLPRAQIRPFLAFYPQLPKGSQLEIDGPVKPVGFDELSALLRQTTKRVSLSEKEIVALAQSLHLTRWDGRGATQPIRRLIQPAQPWPSPKGMRARAAWLSGLSAPGLRLTTPLQPQPVLAGD